MIFVYLVKHFPSACEKMVEAVKKMVFQGKRRSSVLCYCIFYGILIGLDAEIDLAGLVTEHNGGLM